MVEDKDEIFIQCGECDVKISKDEQNRTTFEPFCPPNKAGKPELSEEARALKEAFLDDEVVLKTPRVKDEE